jgi:hypothetical protein
MLNTIPVMRGGNQNGNKDVNLNNNQIKNNIIEQMTKETDIERGIRQIEERSQITEGILQPDPNPNSFDSLGNTDIAKSFHSMEGKIFGNRLGTINKEKSPKVEGFDLSEITKKYSGSKLPDNMFDTNKKLMISANEKLNKFKVVNDDGQDVGYFTIDHIIKYLSHPYEDKDDKQVLHELDETAYQKAKELIKLLVFKLEYNKKNKSSRIVVLDYNQSGFMADVELLVKLNDMLYKYLENDLNNALAGIKKGSREKMEKNIKKLIYLLLNYTLKLISIISEKLKNNNKREELKKQLVRYSISLVYRISIFVQEQLQIFYDQNKSMKEIMTYNIEIKDEIKDKLNKLLITIQEQNTLISKKQKHKLKENPMKTAKYYEV